MLRRPIPTSGAIKSQRSTKSSARPSTDAEAILYQKQTVTSQCLQHNSCLKLMKRLLNMCDDVSNLFANEHIPVILVARSITCWTDTTPPSSVHTLTSTCESLRSRFATLCDAPKRSHDEPQHSSTLRHHFTSLRGSTPHRASHWHQYRNYIARIVASAWQSGAPCCRMVSIPPPGSMTNHVALC